MISIDAANVTDATFFIPITGAGTRRTSLPCVDVRMIVYSPGAYWALNRNARLRQRPYTGRLLRFVLVVGTMLGKN